MLSRLTPRLTYANVVSTIALFLALSTGVAYASNEWTGDNIVDGSLTGLDIAADSLGTNKIKDENLTAIDLAPNSVGSSEIQTDAVNATEIADDSIDSGEIVDNSLSAADLGTSSVGSVEIASGAVTNSKLGANSVDGSKVATNSLTTSDIAGAAVTGVISLGANAVANGRCADFSIGVSGATAGEAVVISTQAAIPQGILIYGQRVSAAGTVTMKVCNLSGAAMAALTDLPIRIITYS
jgi:hypothetical protein